MKAGLKLTLLLIAVLLLKISCAAKAVNWLTAIYFFTLYAAVNWSYHVMNNLMRGMEFLSPAIKFWDWFRQNDVTLWNNHSNILLSSYWVDFLSYYIKFPVMSQRNSKVLIFFFFFSNFELPIWSCKKNSFKVISWKINFYFYTYEL